MKFYLVTFPDESRPENIGFQFFKHRHRVLARQFFEKRNEAYKNGEGDCDPPPEIKEIEIPKKSHKEQVWWALNFQVIQ